MYTPEEVKKNYIRNIYENEGYKSVINMIDEALKDFGTLENIFTINLPRAIEPKELDRILEAYKYLGGWKDITGELINGRSRFDYQITKLTFTCE